YEQTLKTAMYSTTPFLLLGWIPYVSIIGAIWYIVLLIIGIRETQEMDMGKALLVVIVPIVLILVLALLGGIVIAALIQGMLHMIPFVG
ncbi:MAG: YIP1 family protein, partial [Methanoregula sp.]|nr:YIP1 family protein [Methanoregula sp.]